MSKITIATSQMSGKYQFFNQPILSLQAGACAWTRVVSGVPQQESKVQLGERGLQETQTGVHAWYDLTFVVTMKVYCFSVRCTRVFEFSPESFF